MNRTQAEAVAPLLCRYIRKKEAAETAALLALDIFKQGRRLAGRYHTAVIFDEKLSRVRAGRDL